MAVLSDVGLGYFTDADVREEIEQGRLLPVLGDWSLKIAPLCPYPGRRNPSAAFRAFTEFAREQGAAEI